MEKSRQLITSSIAFTASWMSSEHVQLLCRAKIRSSLLVPSRHRWRVSDVQRSMDALSRYHVTRRAAEDHDVHSILNYFLMRGYPGSYIHDSMDHHVTWARHFFNGTPCLAERNITPSSPENFLLRSYPGSCLDIVGRSLEPDPPVTTSRRQPHQRAVQDGSQLLLLQILSYGIFQKSGTLSIAGRRQSRKKQPLAEQI